ncbi:hypothetical protein MTO96_010671 [Rhipicephalus appendiculatus]
MGVPPRERRVRALPLSAPRRTGARASDRHACARRGLLASPQRRLRKAKPPVRTHLRAYCRDDLGLLFAFVRETVDCAARLRSSLRER